jgi:hypothetical protein
MASDPVSSRMSAIINEFSRLHLLQSIPCNPEIPAFTKTAELVKLRPKNSSQTTRRTRKLLARSKREYRTVQVDYDGAIETIDIPESEFSKDNSFKDTIKRLTGLLLLEGCMKSLETS